MRAYTKRTPHPRPCPHCGKLFAVVGVHEPACIHNPARREQTRQALDAGDGYIRRSGHYHKDARGGISRDSLLAEYGDWESVAAAFGLRLQPGNYQSGKAALSKLDRVVAQLGPQIDTEMAEFRRLTHAAYRG